MHSCGHIDHTHCSSPELVLHTLSISHAFAYVCLWKSNISRSSFLPRPGRSCSFNMGSPVLVAVGLNAGELGSDVLRDGRWRRVPWSRLFHFAELQFVSRRRTSFTAWCCHDCGHAELHMITGSLSRQIVVGLLGGRAQGRQCSTVFLYLHTSASAS